MVKRILNNGKKLFSLRYVDISIMNEVKPKVLIAEDDPIIASDIKEYLVNKGFDVISFVRYGFEAVDIAKEKKPDLVLLDIILELIIPNTDSKILLLKLPIRSFITHYYK